MKIQDYYNYSQFSSLAYVNWDPNAYGQNADFVLAIQNANSADRIPGKVDPNSPAIDTPGEKLFAPATDGGQGWKVSDFHPNDATGFKASLFTNPTTGQKVLAVSGTEPDSWAGFYADLLKADLQEIGTYGMAISQAISLFNYVQRLQGERFAAVVQLNLNIEKKPPLLGPYVVCGSGMETFYISVSTATGVGLGLVDHADNVTITGHSLGGHLAAIGQRLFPDIFDATVTFNAPGFDPNLGISPSLPWDIVSSGQKLTDEFLDTLFRPYLATSPLSDFGNINILVSEDSAPGNDGSGVSSTWVTGTQVGPQQFVITEQNSHMIEPFMDSLAVQALLEQMKPDLSLEGAGRLIQAATKVAGKSEEIILDALSQLLFGEALPRLADTPNDVSDGVFGHIWISPGDFSKRTKIHERIIEIETALDGQNLGLSSLVDLSTTEMQNITRSDIAYRYALVQGNPFAVLGADYSTFNQNGELDLYDPATGQGQLSNMYLADRAEFLACLIEANLDDSTDVGGEGPPILFTDIREDGKDIHVNSGQRSSLLDQARYTFGSGENDSLVGSSHDDRLFGMEGQDRLEGRDGNDYLEGGRGNDRLDGGVGDDIYVYLPGGGEDVIDDVLTSDTGRNRIIVGDFDLSEIQVDNVYGRQQQSILVFTDTTNGLTLEWDRLRQTVVIMGSALDGTASLSAVNSITINNIGDLSQLRERFGIDLPLEREGALQAGAANPYSAPDFIVGEDTGAITENGGTQLSFFTNRPLGTGDTVTVEVAASIGISPDQLFATTGDQQISFANGGVTLNVAEGMAFVPFAVSHLGDLAVDGLVILTATIHTTDENGDPLDIVTNPFSLQITDAGEPFQGATDFLMAGDETDNDLRKETAGNWTILGHGGNDIIDDGLMDDGDDLKDGGAGDDTVHGRGGNDIVIGGSGQDILDGSSGDDLVYADQEIAVEEALAQSDAAASGIKGDWLDGGEGTDTLIGGVGNDVVNGGLGSDFIVGGAGDDDIDGDGYFSQFSHDWEVVRSVENVNGVDRYVTTIFGASIETAATGGDDSIYAGGGADWVSGGYGDDAIDGGSGDDVIFGNEGNDVVLGGDGDDHCSGDDAGATSFGDDFLDGGTGNDDLAGNGGNDALYGGAGDDALYGGTGHDYLNGEADNDTLVGGEGADTLFGGDGDDRLTGDASNIPDEQSGDDYLGGGSGDDLLYGGGGADVLLGGTGIDTLYGNTGDDFLDGGSGNDTLIGAEGADGLYGGDGDDTLVGDADNLAIDSHGDDYLDGEAGNDRLQGGGGDDILIGGDGDDLLWGESGDDDLRGDDGNDQLGGGIGNDRLAGGSGDDTLFGEDGEDTLEGGDNSDQLVGGADNDTLLGEGGNDSLWGGEGDDLLSGGSGTDYLLGGAGSDTYSFSRGDGTLDANGQVDTVEDMEGRSLLHFDETVDRADLAVLNSLGGNDLLFRYSADDYLILREGFLGNYDSLMLGDQQYSLGEIIGQTLTGNLNVAGTEMDDRLYGGLGSDILSGNAGNDFLSGGAGDDLLVGGMGWDTAEGGSGQDTYLFQVGDGRLTIIDAGSNTLRFGPGITADDISLGLGSLMIRTGTAGDEVHIANFVPEDPRSQIAIDRFEFADGTVLTYDELLARGFDLTGSDDDDAIAGTALIDRIFAGAGNDSLNGGGGNDELHGENGNDTYLFGRSSGEVVIEDLATDAVTSSADRIRFIDGIAPQDVKVSRAGDDLQISLAGATGSLVLKNWRQGDPANRIEWFDFEAAASWDLAAIEAAIDANAGPVVSASVDLGTLQEDGTLLITASELLARANDADGDSLSVSILTVDTGSLVDYGDGTWSYAPEPDATGPVRFNYEISDGRATVATSASLEVLAVNDPPVVSGPVDLGTLQEDGGRLLTAAELLAHASDVEDDSLVVTSLTVDTGSLVDHGDGTWSYAPEADASGPVCFSYEISDGQATVITSASLEVLAVNDPPVVSGPVDLGTLQEDGGRLLTAAELLAQASDVDGDSLVVTSLTVDTGSLVDHGDGTWNYAPEADASGPVEFSYAVSDGSETTPATARLEVAAVNDAPELATPLSGQTVRQDSPFNYRIPVGAFTDPDVGDSLSFAATLSDGSPLPAWLNFDAASGLFTGTPDSADVGTMNIRVVATDSDGLRVDAGFALEVQQASAVNVITGTEDADHLIGSDGDDLLDGGRGIDVLVGGRGNDTYYVDGHAEEADREDDAQRDHDRDEDEFEEKDRDRREDRDESPDRDAGGRRQRWLRHAATHFRDTEETDREDRDRGEVFRSDDDRHDADDDDSHEGDRRRKWFAEGRREKADPTVYLTDIVLETPDGGYDTVHSSVSYRLAENVEDLYLTGSDDLDGTGNELDNRIVGNTGNNDLTGGRGSDVLQGGEGNDNYLFNLGDGDDTIVNEDADGLDRIVFGEEVSPSGVSLLRRGENLEIGYGTADRVTVNDFFTTPETRIDQVQLADGTLLTAADIDAIVQQMSAYAIREGIALDSLAQVRQDQNLMNLVVDSWHRA